jgi:hypothetical protein
LEFSIRISPFLSLKSSESLTWKPNFSYEVENESDFSSTVLCLGSVFGSLLEALFLKLKFFLGMSSELRLSRDCLRSETALREERTL